METDLTPEEARAEVEAFLGKGWTALVETNGPLFYAVCAERDDVKVRGISTTTLRSAVGALKSVWRDAVRTSPWELTATCRAVENFSAPRVLKEDDK